MEKKNNAHWNFLAQTVNKVKKLTKNKAHYNVEYEFV